MSVEPGIAGVGSILARLTPRERERDHWFFSTMAVAAAVVVFVGFAPTYYLRSVVGAAAPLTPLVHLHGVVSTSWMLLFLAQTSLVRVGRTDLHMRLGIAGAVLAPVLLVVGYLTAIEAARLGHSPPGGLAPLGFLAVPIVTLVTFAVLAGAGLYYRRTSHTHKRLMLLATIAILMPALARFRYYGLGGPPVGIGGTWLFVTTCLVYDRSVHGRVHPAFLWGGLFLVLSAPLRFALGRTDAWRSVAEWLTR